jgi:hypothetical protein
MYSARPGSVYRITNKLPCFVSYLLAGINKFLETKKRLAFKIYIDKRACCNGPNNCEYPYCPATVFKYTDLHFLRCLVF